MMETPYIPPLTAPATAGHMKDLQPAQKHPDTQRQYRTHRCASCNTPYPFQAFETKTILDGFGQPAWTIALEVDFRKLFPDGIHCVQDLRPVTANPNSGPADPEETKKREAMEMRRIKKDKRKEASGRAKQKEMAWREEIVRIELLRKNAPLQASADPNTVPAQSPLQGDEMTAMEATGDTTASDSARNTPPTLAGNITQPPRDDIQLRIQQYQDRRLLEEKEKDERIAKEKARREEQLLAEARGRWENERLAKEEARAEAVRQSAVAVQEIRMRQELAQQAEKATAERERARLAEEQANEEHLIRQQAQKIVNQQQSDAMARRAREQEQALKEQTALEQARRNQIQDRIRLEQETVQRQREQARQEQVQRGHEQEQARREQQMRDQMAGLELARRQQVLYAQRQQAQREEEQARREQAIRERNQREQAQREQAQREQAQREQAQQQLAGERAQREQAEEQKRRDLALAQQQLARREQAEEQKRRELAKAQALAQEQTRRAQAEELLRPQTERAANEAAENLAKQDAMQAEGLLSRGQGSQHRSSFSDYQADPQYQESPPIQSIRIPPSSDILSASGVETFSGQRNLPGGQQATQLVNSNVMMELQSAMISVQSQIIATQSKLYGLQNELNGPERSILKHVQHNLLTEQLQSMVSMYNKIQLQLAGRQQPPPQSQRPAQAQYTQEPSYSSQQSYTTHQHIPNQPRPQQVVRPPPFQSQQTFSAPQARPTQQSRPQQASSWQQMRSDAQPSTSRGSFSNGNSGMNATHQADTHPVKQTNMNAVRSSFMTRQSSANSQTGQTQAPMPTFHPRPAQQPVTRQDNAPPPQQMRPHANQDVSMPIMRGGQPEQPSLMSLYPQSGPSSRHDNQPQSLTNPLQPNDRPARVTPPSAIPSTSHAQSKSPPAQNVAQNALPQQTMAEGPASPEGSNTQMVAHSKMQDYSESHSLVAKAQLLKAQHIQRMQLAQMARPPLGMGGLSGAMLMDGLRSVQGVSSVRPPALENRSVATSLVPAPMAMPTPFDPFTPGAMEPSPFLLGDVHDIVPLPASSPEDAASRFTEIIESPNGKTATRPTPDVPHKPLSSIQIPDKATESNSNSNGGAHASPAAVEATHENSTSSTARDPTPPDVPAHPEESVLQAPSKETVASPEKPNPPGSDVGATIIATVQSPKHVSPCAASSARDTTQVAVADELPFQPIVATTTNEPSTNIGDVVPKTSAKIVDNKTSRTRQRSESADEHVVEERPTKRRRTDQSRFMPPREDVSLSSPNRATSARAAPGSAQRRADKPSWKAMSDSSDSESEMEAATVTATTTVVLDQPFAPNAVNNQTVDIAPSTAPSSTPPSTNFTSPSSSQQAAKASSVRLTLEKVFQKNPHPSDAVFDKLAMALKIEDVEPVKKLFALWRQNGHQPNTGLQT